MRTELILNALLTFGVLAYLAGRLVLDRRELAAIEQRSAERWRQLLFTIARAIGLTPPADATVRDLEEMIKSGHAKWGPK